MVGRRKTVLLTGASSGVGLEIAKHFAALPVKLIAVCRTNQTANITTQLLQSLNAVADIQTPVCDLENSEEVLQLCSGLHKEITAVDICIFNAACIMPSFQLTKEGIEKQLAVNHLSSFIMCHQLLPLFKNSQNCKLVFLSSRVYKLADKDYKMVLGKQKFYHPTLAYAETKLMSLVFANYFSEKVKPDKIEVFNLNLGTVKTEIGNKHTTFFQGLLWNCMKFFGRSAEKAVRDITSLLSNESSHSASSTIWYKGRALSLEQTITDTENVSRVMNLSFKLTGITNG